MRKIIFIALTLIPLLAFSQQQSIIPFFPTLKNGKRDSISGKIILGIFIQSTKMNLKDQSKSGVFL